MCQLFNVYYANNSCVGRPIGRVTGNIYQQYVRQ